MSTRKGAATTDTVLYILEIQNEQQLLTNVDQNEHWEESKNFIKYID